MEELQPESKPEFVPYPRAEVETPSADKLRALSQAYFGMNWVFLLNVALLLVTLAVVGPGRKQTDLVASVLVWLSLPLLVGLATYPVAKKASYGAGWSSRTATITAILMGLNAL